MCINHCFEKTLHYTSPGHGGWGVIRVAALIPESHLMFICPSACFRHGALGAIQHGYKDKTSYLYITPADVVVGYDNIILEGAQELLERDKKIKVLFLFVPCIDDFIGTDIDALAKQVEKAHPGIIVRSCHMNPIAAETKKPPLVTTMQSMLSAIHTSHPASENAVNLLGTFSPVDRESEIFSFFSSYGYQVRQIADYEKYEDFCEMGRSKYNLVTGSVGKFAAGYMDKHFSTTSVINMLSYDVEEIMDGYKRWQEVLKKEQPMDSSFSLKTLEKETLNIIHHTAEKLKDYPVLVSDSAVIRPFALAKALLGYGFKVTEVIAQDALEGDREAYQYILEHHPEVSITQPRHYRSARRENTFTRTIAIGFEGAYLRQSDYVVDLSGDEGMYGFYGVKRLMEMMANSIKKKADLRKMIEEYGAVV